MKKTNLNFWLDICIFVSFLMTAITGIALWLLRPYLSIDPLLGFSHRFWLTAHIGSGLASVAGSVIHVIWHREWLKALRKRRIASLPPKLRSNRVVDRFVWISFLATTVFGVSDWIFFALENDVSLFTRLHVAFGIICMLGIIGHLALHKKWITASIESNFQFRKRFGIKILVKKNGAGILS